MLRALGLLFYPAPEGQYGACGTRGKAIWLQSRKADLDAAIGTRRDMGATVTTAPAKIGSFVEDVQQMDIREAKPSSKGSLRQPTCSTTVESSWSFGPNSLVEDLIIF